MVRGIEICRARTPSRPFGRPICGHWEHVRSYLLRLVSCPAAAIARPRHVANIAGYRLGACLITAERGPITPREGLGAHRRANSTESSPRQHGVASASARVEGQARLPLAAYRPLQRRHAACGCRAWSDWAIEPSLGYGTINAVFVTKKREL